jgi:hypothetical protein
VFASPITAAGLETRSLALYGSPPAESECRSRRHGDGDLPARVGSCGTHADPGVDPDRPDWNDNVTQSSGYSKHVVNDMYNDMFGNYWAHVTNDDKYDVKRGYSLALGGMYRFSREWAVGAVV